MSVQAYLNKKIGISLLAGLVLLMIVTGNNLADNAPDYRTVTDIDYKGDAGIAHRLDLYIPLDSEFFTTLIYIAGGMENNNSKARTTDIGEHFTSLNFAVVIPNRSSNLDSGLDTNADEIANAIAWTLNNIELYGGDSSRIIVMTQSAGARPLALAVMNPVYLEQYNHDISEITGMIFMDGLLETEAKHALLNLIPDRQPETVAYFSPVNYIDSNTPPTLFINGETEVESIMEFTANFADLINTAGGQADWTTVPGRHGEVRAQIGTESDHTSATILNWIDSLFIDD